MQKSGHKLLLSAVFLSALMLIPVPGLHGQTRKFTVSGYVKDALSGEVIIGAVVNPVGSSNGVSTNAYGFYSLSLPEGGHQLSFSILGYQADTLSINLTADLRQDVLMNEESLTLQGANVTAVSRHELLHRPEMGIANLSGDFIKKVPVMFGESDLIKVIQMMPGVQSPSEGSTGFSVRGGGVDQNLILMDEAPVYNAGHFLGFFSVFNNDAVKNADLFKGDIAPKYGGRLSSLLDIQTLDGNMQEFGGSLSVGLISSKVLLQGPIVPKKASFMVAARRTYVDLFFPLFKGLKGDRMFFYDVNAKANWIINDNNRLYFSAFSGKDLFSLNNESMTEIDMRLDFANNTQSLRWNHIFSPKLFANFTLLNSFYDFGAMLQYSATDIDFSSNLHNQAFKSDFSWFVDVNNTIGFGVQANYYTISPAEFVPLSEGILGDYTYPKSNAAAPDFYIQNDQKVTDWLSLRYGVRLSTFATLGKRTQRYYNADHSFDREQEFDRWEPIQWFHALEPRASSSFKISESMSFKAAYSRNVQYIQQAVYSISGSPFDIWFTASPNVKPQISNQYSAGIFKNFLDDRLETSLELFYKDNINTIDFKDHPNVIMNEDMEAELRTGKSHVSGLETMVKYADEKFNGWVSYTWSKSIYEIPEINGGKPYESPMNHKHSISVVGSYDITSRLSASADWVYYSGAATTFPSGVYELGGRKVPLYSDRNQDHFPDYHRLDLSLTLQGGRIPKGERWHGEWNLSVYNVYARHNAWALDFHYDNDNEFLAKKYYLFTAIPSLSYTLTF